LIGFLWYRRRVIEACSVEVFQWYRTLKDIPAIDMTNSTSAGIRIQLGREKDYIDKADPIREHDCI
jgi:hypothetical protein